MIGKEKQMKCTELSISQWFEVLTNENMTLPKDLDLLKVLYGFPNHQAASSQLGGNLYGCKKDASHVAKASPVNLQVYRYAKRIRQFVSIPNFHFSLRKNGKECYWDFFFKGWYEGRLFIWQLKPNLVKALEKIFFCEQEIVVHKESKTVIAEEIPSTVFYEGMQQQIVVNRYERDWRARRACIDYWGKKCSVCGFVFLDMYGEIGKNFIHVHHITPLSELTDGYQVNPKEDLRPVCPNCHAMLHQRTPPYSIEELKEIIFNHRKKQGI
ncbi:Predicted restriction endonuclease [Haemophilus pittmaniae]|uniref:Predicted restriction endonuclease n=1 Tax=Haemophilus pittmaniae TaxID=249188 RepID=A0A377IZB3_9PAST|nr:HNH endonuclease [Haemophilus pittmaniae]STO92887.1 Predicted restriction endonuclease [Haemophilus pittmaniae]